VHILARYGWLAHAAPAFRDFMLANLIEQDVEAGVAVTHAGDELGGIFAMIEGQCQFFTTIGSSGTGMTQLGYPGSWWGQAPLLGMRRVGFVIARTRSRVGIVPLAAVKVHLAEYPAHWEEIAHCYTDLFRQTAGAHVDSIIPDHRKRMAATLLRLGGNRHRRFAVDVPESFLCPQEDLAGAMGLARNTVGRLLRALAADQLLSQHYGRVRLLDVRRLEALADGE
jgi:CRP/FNR family transcriptional regulator, cyclic AMP receptor protein